MVGGHQNRGNVVGDRLYKDRRRKGWRENLDGTRKPICSVIRKKTQETEYPFCTYLRFNCGGEKACIKPSEKVIQENVGDRMLISSKMRRGPGQGETCYETDKVKGSERVQTARWRKKRKMRVEEHEFKVVGSTAGGKRGLNMVFVARASLIVSKGNAETQLGGGREKEDDVQRTNRQSSGN